MSRTKLELAGPSPLITLNAPPKPKVKMNDVITLASRSMDVMQQVRDAVLLPHPRKNPPRFTQSQFAEILGIEPSQIKTKQKQLGKILGNVQEGDKKKTYSLSEFYEVNALLGKSIAKPEGKKGKVITVASYKGGVSKTTTAVTLAQGLTLRGFEKVLLVDIDSQGSASSLMGVSPELEVQVEDTIMDYIFGDQPNLMSAVRETYWPNLDLIAASSALIESDYVFPAWIRDKKDFAFWAVLDQGLEPLRDIYDAIVIDTSPSLGYLTQNAMYAADGLICPCPQEALGFASLAQFFTVYTELVKLFPKIKEVLEFDFVEVMITKGKSDTDETAQTVKGWLKEAYGNHLSGISIPDSVIPTKAASVLSTVYEINKTDAGAIQFTRYKDQVDAFVSHIAGEIIQSWRK
ncbi:chromosome partitioning protein [Polynucleobacter sphagniphilus]|uniref:ParA family protein n=1 Tax=Polynucleobacter sphagniphilus TaxID=1743169 RepID=UPI0024744647|nr:AAA family ATPase [Polynucleobacter sphagniphilus]MDH6303278.1 chromosome partitioning protein [Polynucleobacter sphagniphilus]